ncbi:MAG: DNA replication/repair protein RecF [Lawsonella sp.]
MFLRHCELHNYRSWEHLALDLEPGITLFVGANGQGKTNFVEGINYLSCLRSHRVSQDGPLIREGCDTATITGTAVHRGRELTVAVEINKGKSNQATINTASCKTRELLGVVATTLFAPEDLNLVRGEPAIRRNYLDDLLVQRRPRLSAVLSDYEKVLRQRNALLKSANMALRHGYNTEAGTSALTTLDAWDAQLAQHGATIIAHRLHLLHELSPYVADNYQSLAPGSRPTALHYQSIPELTIENCGTTTPPDQDFIEAALLAGLAAQRDKEIDRGITLAGPHRDDITLMLGVHPAKGFASQGETWSYALSLRLAAYNLMTEDGTEPILLLDDVFSELDKYRREALATVVANAEQTLITAAVGDDLPEKLQPVAVHTVTAHGDANYRISELDREVDNG